MNALRDTLIALFFASMLALMALKISSNTKEHVITTRQSLTTQQNMKVITDIIENDFRKIGHSLVNPFAAITLAYDSRIIFSYDNDPSSTFDSMRVEYYLEDETYTPNPNDKKLVRKINSSSALGASLGVTNFILKYYNGFGTLLPTPVATDSLPKIREIEITLDMQNTQGFKGEYGSAKYVTRIIPKNLLITF